MILSNVGERRKNPGAGELTYLRQKPIKIEVQLKHHGNHLKQKYFIMSFQTSNERHQVIQVHISLENKTKKKEDS